MITPMQMYWLTRCDSIVTVGIILSVFLMFMLIGLFITYAAFSASYEEDERNCIMKILPWNLVFFILSLMISVFVPTTKEMAAIVVVPAIANNEKVQESAKNLIDLANEWMVELKPSKMKSDEK